MPDQRGEAYWGELSMDEKLERMREQVRKIREIQRELRTALAALAFHRHDGPGEAVRRLVPPPYHQDEHRICRDGPDTREGKVYF